MNPALALIRANDSAPAASTGRPNTVKRRLTSRRARRAAGNDEYAAFARRVLRGYARRVATGPEPAAGSGPGAAVAAVTASCPSVAGRPGG